MSPSVHTHPIRHLLVPPLFEMLSGLTDWSGWLEFIDEFTRREAVGVERQVGNNSVIL
jgi:hypothetical protein